MTYDQQTEWNYLYHERIAILCGTNEPTPEQDRIARDEADAAIKRMNHEKTH